MPRGRSAYPSIVHQLQNFIHKPIKTHGLYMQIALYLWRKPFDLQAHSPSHENLQMPRAAPKHNFSSHFFQLECKLNNSTLRQHNLYENFTAWLEVVINRKVHMKMSVVRVIYVFDSAQLG